MYKRQVLLTWSSFSFVESKNREHCFLHPCVLSLSLLSICFPLFLRIRSIPSSPCLRSSPLTLSLPSPYDRVVARRRIRGRCSWHHRSCIIDQLSQGSGEEVSSPSGSCKIPTTRESPSRSLNSCIAIGKSLSCPHETYWESLSLCSGLYTGWLHWSYLLSYWG